MFLARPERFELPTARFVAEYSIQLSYGRIVWFSRIRGGAILDIFAILRMPFFGPRSPRQAHSSTL